MQTGEGNWTASDKLFVRFAKVPYAVGGIYFTGEEGAV